MVGAPAWGSHTWAVGDAGVAHSRWKKQQAQRARSGNSCGCSRSRREASRARAQEVMRGAQAGVTEPSDGYSSWQICHNHVFRYFYCYSLRVPSSWQIFCHPGRTGVGISTLVLLYQFLREFLHLAGQGRTCFLHSSWRKWKPKLLLKIC